MKRKLLFVLSVVLVLVAGTVLVKKYLDRQEIKTLQKKHAAFLENSPFNKTKDLSKKERKALGLPPNAYFEQMWRLKMDPSLGRPASERLFELQNSLRKDFFSRVPGDASDNNWISRGPTNVGGRTRAIMFDPNDATNRRVFAGGVSGGLWVINDITNPASTWVQVTGVPGNLAVSAITYDPNNTQTMYLGTGELYTAGDATGNGIYKSTDGGTTWTNVFGGQGTTQTGAQFIVPGFFFVTDIIVWDADGNSATTNDSQVFASIGSSFYAESGSIATFLGVAEYGLYRSTNNGANWNRITINNGAGRREAPNDLEIGADNKIWMSTTRNVFGDLGGTIWSSTNGSTFTFVNQIPNADRTEIEPSSTDANKFYVLIDSSINGEADIFITTNAFATITPLPEPDDVDTGIPASDFTRGQAFYDLVVEADPTNDAIVYIGGIDLFRSDNSGVTWTQISKWSNNNNLAALPVSLVHADQHGFVFRPGNNNQAIVAHDGGVDYCTSLSVSGASATFVTMETDYITTQFYRSAISPFATTGSTSETIMGGTQDNGTPYFFERPANPQPQDADLTTGDGGFCYYDQVGENYLIVNNTNNQRILLFTLDGTTPAARIVGSSNDGDFINPGALDSNLDILYVNGRSGSTQRLYRYSDLTNPTTQNNNTRTTLTNALLNSNPSAFIVSPFTTGSTTLLVGLENGRLLRLTNANTATPTWTNISDINFLGSISDVEFGATENDLFVTFYNYGIPGNVWYSNNGGATWSNKEGNLPDLPVRCILQNPLNTEEVIIGTELGIWRTDNFSSASPTWVQSQNGMADVPVTDLQFRASDNTVLAATYGRGLFTGQFTAGTLSVEDKIVTQNVKVYPTIARNYINVAVGTELGEANLSIFNLNGQQMKTLKQKLQTRSPLKVDFNLAPGVYFLKIETEKGKTTKKFVVR